MKLKLDNCDFLKLKQVELDHLHSLKWSESQIQAWFGHYHSAMIAYLKEINSYVPNNEGECAILESGCGGGYLSYLLNFCGYNVIGGDICSLSTPAGSFWVFSQKIERRPTFARFDGRHLPFRNNLFDAVVANAVLEHIGLGEVNYLLEVSRVAKLHGYLFIYELPRVGSYEYFAKKLGVKTAHERFFNEEYMRELLHSAGFEILLIRRYWYLPRLFSKFMPDWIFNDLKDRAKLSPCSSFLKIVARKCR